MTKKLTREVINTIVNRALERLTEDEREDMLFETYDEHYYYEDDLLTYTMRPNVIKHFADKLEVNTEDLTIFVNPNNILDYDDDHELLF